MQLSIVSDETSNNLLVAQTLENRREIKKPPGV